MGRIRSTLIWKISLRMSNNTVIKTTFSTSSAAAVPHISTSSLFTDITQTVNYSQFRPDYPQLLYDLVYARCSVASRDVAVDVATGTGQVALVLKDSFESVFAIDTSNGQLKQLNDIIQRNQITNISAFNSKAEDIETIESNSVDLVTVAQALHWFDIPSFYQEAHRILKHDAVLAVWGYDCAYLTNSSTDPGTCAKDRLDKANKGLYNLYKEQPLIEYWDAKRSLVDNHLRGYEPTAALYKDVERVDLLMKKDITVDHLIGYVRSFSAYTSYMKGHKYQQGDAINDPAEMYKNLLMQLYNNSADTVLTINWPVFLLLSTCNK